jgi:hypothetical protein
MLGILPFNQHGRGMLLLFSLVALGVTVTMLYLIRRNKAKDNAG